MSDPSPGLTRPDTERWTLTTSPLWLTPSRMHLAVFGHTFLLFWSGTCPNRSEMAVGFTGTDFQADPSILEPFRTIFDVFGPT